MEELREGLRTHSYRAKKRSTSRFWHGRRDAGHLASVSVVLIQTSTLPTGYVEWLDAFSSAIPVFPSFDSVRAAIEHVTEMAPLRFAFHIFCRPKYYPEC